MENNYYPFINLPLPYAYNSLEPFIDEKTMYLHHDKHLQTYIDNLNTALKAAPHLQKLSLTQLIKYAKNLPDKQGTIIRNNAGGVYNHRFFFNLLTNPAQKQPTGKLADMINQHFGSYENFITAFKEAALSVFGSGYAWLVYHNGQLKIVTTPNQNNPIEDGFCPILTIDVWEHAYYLKHYNVRADYISDFMNIINWNEVEKNLIDCMS